MVSYDHTYCTLSVSAGWLCLLVPESVIFSVVKTFMTMILTLISFPKNFVSASGKHGSVSSSQVRMDVQNETTQVPLPVRAGNMRAAIGPPSPQKRSGEGKGERRKEREAFLDS